MKKLLPLAIFLCLSGCYAPLNNSGVSTNKAWLDIPAKKVDFEGKQYDACYQFRLHFVPAQAVAQLDLHESCIDSCCWRSDKEEVVLDFNAHFEQNLKFYGRAEKYTPDKITLKITHSNLLNTSAVHVSPRGAISPNGTVRLKVKTVEDPVRLAQLEAQARQQAARHHPDEEELANTRVLQAQELAEIKKRTQNFLLQQEGARIDQYFYQINQSYKKKGYIFFISQRMYQATPLPDGSYQVSCHALVQTGAHPEQLHNRSLSCGIWKVDLAQEKISPADSTARKIKTGF